MQAILRLGCRHYSLTSRIPHYTAISLLAAFACATSAYLFLPSAPSRAAPTSATETLSPQHFTPSTVLSTEDTGPDTKIITLRIKPALVPSHFIRETTAPLTPNTPAADRRIYSIFIKDSDIQVERAYTPLQCADKEGKIQFWVKKYEHGEVGRWLHEKKAGDVIELRGPIRTWDWSWRDCEGEWDDVVMISGGTGITPFYQFLHSLFSSPASLKGHGRTRYTLLHASRTPMDLPPPSILDPLAKFASEYSDIFRMRVFVDLVPGGCPSIAGNNALELGRIGKDAISQSLELKQMGRWWWQTNTKAQQKKVLFLVCGPESMINAIAGPYGRNLSQGLVGGILGDMGYTPKNVWKF
ncbi:hypothetical protein AMATHDRAFT_74117 [Amanita thiersii Skay4041]|uniref:FAD-binding FR-type domain-containing protein n=1 Tax=Amanita thiersii Skay4041 TaxID=703135 RepID=A0A2A9NXV4_9AGAR|nr:hypothetical protein AMATHDRAFT_74117 [Amanita thiersii Skay4041]